MAAILPGVGNNRSKVVESYFKSLKAMVNATEDEWLQIDGIGKTIARNVVEEMNRES